MTLPTPESPESPESPDVRASRRARALLCFDAGAGGLVGLGVLMLQDWLAALYGFSPGLVRVLGTANLVYAAYSGTLALRASVGTRPSPGSLVALVVGNALWALVCVGIAAQTWEHATALGSGVVAFEALFVGTLALVESRILLRR